MKEQQANSISGIILVLLLLIVMITIPYAIDHAPAPTTTSSQASTEHPARHNEPSTAELIPVLTGGLGGSTPLGGFH